MNSYFDDQQPQRPGRRIKPKAKNQEEKKQNQEPHHMRGAYRHSEAA
jgi:hypothetical protein